MSRFFDKLALTLPGVPADVSLPARIRRIVDEIESEDLTIQIQSGVARGPHLIIVSKDGTVWVCINEQITKADIDWALTHIESKDPQFVITLVATTGVTTPEVREKSRRQPGLKWVRSKDPKQIAESVRHCLDRFAFAKRRKEESEEYPM